MQTCTKWNTVYFCSRCPWESIWACIALFFLISSVFIYVRVKKLTICCWTSLYPCLHPCCCCCCFFLLFLRLFAPRRRSLLGLVLLNPPLTLFQHRPSSLFSSALTTSRLQLGPACPMMAALAAQTNSPAFSPLLSLHNHQIWDLLVDRVW